MITTDNDEFADRVVLYRRDGMSYEKKYYHEVIGYNYRLTNMQAAVGLGQIERADEIINEKIRVAETYRECLSDAPLRFQDEPSWASPTYWMNTPVFETAVARDDIVESLTEADIQTRPFFHPLHAQPPYRDLIDEQLTVSLEHYDHGINLPSSPLLTDDEIERVCNVIKNASG
jgi:perosamine synthetase